MSASQFLEYFMFTDKQQYSLVEKLSGGERRRLYLLTVLMHNPNFLILDEPTNDLDIVTLNVLEEYLKSFKGCLLLVSHDRFFTDKLADHIFASKATGLSKIFRVTTPNTRTGKKKKRKKRKRNGQPPSPCPPKRKKTILPARLRQKHT